VEKVDNMFAVCNDRLGL